MGNPVIHFEIMSPDPERLRAFYGDLFGWEVNADNAMDYGLVDREKNLSPEGFGIGGGIGRMPEGQPGHLTFYVGVEDVEAALAKAESLGGTRIMGPARPPGGNVEVGLAKDPEGHVVGVVRPLM